MGFWDGGGISWTICKSSAPRSRQIATPTHTPSLSFYRPDALPDTQPTVSKHWSTVTMRNKDKTEQLVLNTCTVIDNVFVLSTAQIKNTPHISMIIIHLQIQRYNLHHIWHTKTHPFNGPFSRTTRVNRYQKGETNLHFTEARDSEWQWHQLGQMQVCNLLQTDNHSSTPPSTHTHTHTPV